MPLVGVPAADDLGPEAAQHQTGEGAPDVDGREGGVDDADPGEGLGHVPLRPVRRASLPTRRRRAGPHR